MEITYIDNDRNKGIKYDWKKIAREYKRLKVPKGVYNPLRCDFETHGYCVAMSTRSRGKTTNPLLVGMIMHELYGTIIHYVRCTADMIKPKALKDLFRTVLEFGYIEKITGGAWNSCYYYGKRWYYCNVDETGKIIDKCPEHFMYVCCLPDADDMKSAYTCPRGDIIIFDEFIQMSGYGYNDFIRFADICSTIIRGRLCPIIYMLSNTIDLSSPWFDEYAIRDDVNTMQQGECRSIVSPLGTHIFVEILTADTTEQRENVNRRFFGFTNPKLAAITGKGTWAVESYPHIPHNKDIDEHATILYNKLFMMQSGKLLKLQLVKNPIGLCVYVVPATETYKDSWILTHGEIYDRRMIYGLGGKNTILDVYWKLYKMNRWYYTTNIDGELIKSYIEQTVQKNRHRGI